MSDVERILTDIDKHDASVRRAELRRIELGNTIGDLITGIALNEVAIELADITGLYTPAESEAITAEVATGRKTVHDLVDEAIRVTKDGLLSQHAQEELRAQLIPPTSEL
jgi:hypothetical protein